MKNLHLFLLAGLGLCLGSCTVSEPNSVSGTSENYRLKSLKSMGVTMMSFSYDGQGRLTECNIGGEFVATLTYQGTSRIPVKIVEEDYEYFDVDGKEIRQKIDEVIINNISGNADGTLAACDTQETEWYYDTTYDTDNGKAVLTLRSEYVTTSHTSFTYSNGHLTQVEDKTPGESADITTYTWQNDCLLSITENGDYPTTTTFDYSTVVNTAGQWDPNNEFLGPLAITGLFGKAPSHFVKRITITSQGYVEADVQYSYSLLDNGLINMSRIQSEDTYGEGMIINYVYEKTK